MTALGGERELEALARVVEDFEGLDLDADRHTARWLEQFPSTERAALARSLAAAFSEGYASRSSVAAFLRSVDALVHEDAGPLARAEFLDLYEPGHSQSMLLGALFPNGAPSHERPASYAYLDDLLISGSRAADDLATWVTTDAPPTAELHVIVLRAFEHGLRRALLLIDEAANAARRHIEVTVWTPRLVANCPWHAQLDPLVIPSDGPGLDRATMEQALLRAGATICRALTSPGDYCRPLGFSVERQHGFGALVATHRTCPNHAPLALWYAPVRAGEPAWFPLLPRDRTKQEEERNDLEPENFRIPPAEQMRAVVPHVRALPPGGRP